MFIMVAYADLIMVLGVSILALAFPAAVGAFSRSAPPRAAMLALFAGGCMIVYANATRPGGYTAAEMPDLFVRVLTGA